MNFIKLRAALVATAALFAVAVPFAAPAQVVTTLPVSVSANSVTDLGNGPQEFQVIQGQVGLFTSSSSGVGSTSGSATPLTLTSTAAANPPCIGCIISGAGITSGTTVASFNGTTTIGLSAAMTVAAGTVVAWGKACPTTPGTAKQALAQAGVGNALPFYTQARICAAGNTGPGGQILPFAIGAH